MAETVAPAPAGEGKPVEGAEVADTTIAKKAAQPKKADMIRMLAYLNATRPRFLAWKGSFSPLASILEVDEYNRIEKALKRHGRSCQMETLRLPLDLLSRVLSFLPPASMTLKLSSPAKAEGTSTPRTATTGAVVAGKLMQCCSLFLFLTLENSWVYHPEIGEKATEKAVRGPAPVLASAVLEQQTKLVEMISGLKKAKRQASLALSEVSSSSY